MRYLSDHRSFKAPHSLGSTKENHRGRAEEWKSEINKYVGYVAIYYYNICFWHNSDNRLGVYC